MAKDYWQVLDLRKRSTWGPYDDELIVLHCQNHQGLLQGH